MSLINDALKQASQDQKKNPPPPSPLQLRTADESPRRNYTPPAVMFAVLLVALAFGGVLVGYALQKKSPDSLAVNGRNPDSPATPVESPGVPSLVAKSPAIFSSEANPPTSISPAPAPEISAASAKPVEPAPAVTTNSVAAPVEPPKPVGPKLQGISYNAARPSAIVNNRTVYTGDRVGDFRVTKITLDAVTLASAAGTKVLSLSE